MAVTGPVRASKFCGFLTADGKSTFSFLAFLYGVLAFRFSVFLDGALTLFFFGGGMSSRWKLKISSGNSVLTDMSIYSESLVNFVEIHAIDLGNDLKGTLFTFLDGTCVTNLFLRLGIAKMNVRWLCEHGYHIFIVGSSDHFGQKFTCCCRGVPTFAVYFP